MNVWGGHVLELLGVTKRYRGGGGVSDVTLTVEPGEVFGFLGPNGAGKTTTIRLLLDFVRPDSGSIQVLGMDSRHDSVAIRRQVGYLPGDLALYERLTARELLTFFAHLRDGPSWEPIAALLDRLSFGEVDRPIRTLSRGNRQKVGLVQAFMTRPRLVVLDEPTSGLDPLVQREVLELIREVADDGRTVFLSSHALGEVQRVADRVGIIRSGRLVDVHEVAALRERALHRVEVRCAGPAPRGELAALPGVRNLEVDGPTARFELTGRMDPLVKTLARHELLDLAVHEPDLEDVFLAFYDEVPDATR